MKDRLINSALIISLTLLFSWVVVSEVVNVCETVTILKVDNNNQVRKEKDAIVCWYIWDDPPEEITKAVKDNGKYYYLSLNKEYKLLNKN